MAGIGFALRRLAQKDDLTSSLRSYAHAAAVSVGPWLFTVIALGAVDVFGRGILSRDEAMRFSAIIIYSFSFSLVLSGPIVLVLTRHLSDHLYAKKASEVPSILVGGLVLMWSVQAVVGIPFVILATDLSLAEQSISLVVYFVVGAIWLVSIYLTALKSFETISLAFGFGMVVAFALATFLTGPFGVTGTLAGFAFGLGAILYILLARIAAEYPYGVINPFGFLGCFKSYWELALAGLFYNAAIWVDKWIMWLSPGGRVVASGFLSHSSYDAAMFLAYLTIVPAMAIFVVAIETRFFENYLRFYRGIQAHGTLQEIKRDHQAILRSLKDGFKTIAVIQSIICYLALLVAPGLIGMAKGGLELVPVFRFGVLGALFHVMLLFVIVVVSYFDLRRVLLSITAVFFISNAGFTWLFVPFGPAYAGYGYFVASLLTLGFAYFSSARCIKQLPYMTFIGNNGGLR
jgi:uncharacterized membrane protein